MTGRTSHRAFWTALVLSTLIVILVGGAAALSRSAPVIAVSAESEFLRFTVARPEAAVIVLPNASVRGGFEADAEPQGTVQVEPAPGAVVTYRRRGARLAVRVGGASPDEPAGMLRGADGSAVPLTRAVFLTTDVRAGTPVRLPVAGPMEIGTLAISADGRPPGELLLGARVTTFGRAAFTWGRGALYHVQEFALPAGGRLLASGEEGGPPWYGVVLANAEEAALRVEVTAESRALRYEKIGAPQEYEEFGVSLVDAAFSDPSAARWTLLLVVFAAASQTIASLLSLRSGLS